MMHPIENYPILPFETLHIRALYLRIVLGSGKTAAALSRRYSLSCFSTTFSARSRASCPRSPRRLTSSSTIASSTRERVARELRRSSAGKESVTGGLTNGESAWAAGGARAKVGVVGPAAPDARADASAATLGAAHAAPER